MISRKSVGVDFLIVPMQGWSHMIERSWPKTLIVIFLLSAVSAETILCQQLREPGSAGDASSMSCRIVANYDMYTGQPYVSFISCAEKPYPVVYEVSRSDDSSIFITVFMPYTCPSRFPEPIWVGIPSDGLKVYVTYESDTVQYLLTSLADTTRIKISTVSHGDFIDMAPIRDFPDDLLVFQLKGDGERACREISRLLHGKGREEQLVAGFYHGLASPVCADLLGGKCINRTAEGRLLALKIEQPLDDQTWSAIESLAESRRFRWFSTSIDTN